MSFGNSRVAGCTRVRDARLARRILPFVLCLLFASPAAAQDVIEETERVRTERELEIEKAVTGAAKSADSRKPLETKAEVTYEQVLADPDNLDLNFRWAKSQVARGDWTGASATLERILIIKPDATPARLLYASVLYRLDNLEEAEREFRLLREAELPEPQRRQVEQSLAQIKRRQRRTTAVLSTSLGWGFDTNRNASPSAKQRLAFDSLVGVTGSARKRRDTHLLAINSFDVAHTLPSPAGHQLIGSLDYFLGEQTTADDLDLQSFALEGGAVLKTPLVQLTPTGFVSHLSLSRETFLQSQGVNLRGDRSLGKRAALFAEGGWTREDYSGTTENPTASERSGDRVTASFGGRLLLTQTLQLATEVDYTNKDVLKAARHHAYQGFAVTHSLTWLLGKGQFLLPAITYGANSYDAPDPTVSARTRRDQQLRVRVTYGAPVGLFIGGWLPDAVLRNLTAAFSVEQFRSLSNLTNYTYANTKFGLLVTKRVEF